MKTFEEIRNEMGKVIEIKTSLRGKDLLMSRELNKGSCFSKEERENFGLEGKLPESVITFDQQLKRFYKQFEDRSSPITKNIFLNNLKQTNETLFYRLATEHLEEMLPIIYTPTIGDAVKEFSYQFNQPQGLYLSYPNRNKIAEILKNRLIEDIDLILLTDGEGVLGIGDWGVGSMDICIGKLMVYTLCGGVNPRRVLPIQLDVGTNNETLLNDPLYLGWRHKRIDETDYDDFIGLVVEHIRQEFPNVFLHWEDFGRDNARKNLNRYRDEMCTFNDDMQGTGATALACVMSAVAAKREKLSQQQIVFFGAGTAGVGIADQICRAMVQDGISEKEAQDRIWLIDRPGLIMSELDSVLSFQQPYQKSKEQIAKWSVKNRSEISLLEVINNLRPTILIGCSTVHGAFNKNIVKAMSKHVTRPVIFPLSNPTSKAEADPKDIVAWSKGRAIIATGSPYDPVKYKGKHLRISQCNNAFVFPGLGLGVIAVKATRVTDKMIEAAARTLSESSPALKDPHAPVLPDFDVVREVSKKIALAVAEQARSEDVAGVDNFLNLKDKIDALFWKPEYLPYSN